MAATKPYRPWRLVCYTAFEEMKLAKNFEKYLKTGSFSLIKALYSGSRSFMATSDPTSEKIFPTDFTDEEIASQIRALSKGLQDSQFNINKVLQVGPVIMLAQNELQKRINRANTESVVSLREELSRLVKLTDKNAETSAESTRSANKLSKIAIWIAVAAFVTQSVFAIYQIHLSKPITSFEFLEQKNLETLKTAVVLYNCINLKKSEIFAQAKNQTWDNNDRFKTEIYYQNWPQIIKAFGLSESAANKYILVALYMDRANTILNRAELIPIQTTKFNNDLAAVAEPVKKGLEELGFANTNCTLK